MIRIAAAAALLALLAAPAFAQAPVDGAKVFIQCKSCHTLEKGGKNINGPNLHGLFGRKSGGAPGYAYSPAMKAYNKVWDEKTLDVYLAEPMKQVKGTKMGFAGVKNQAQRTALIQYLKTATKAK
jgi:cytochrome c